MSELLAQLIVTVGMLMGVHTASFQPPNVMVVDSCELGRIWESKQSDIKACPASGEDIGGVYIHGQLYLSNRIDLDSLYGRSIFIHELVHWVQDRQGRHKPDPHQCDVAAMEKEAYEIQIQWAMGVLGVDRVAAMKELDMDPLFLAFVTACDVRNRRQ